MKQSLSMGLGQQLTMTPQLQQAIRLMQLSTLDLRDEVQEALETNPMLEEDPQYPGDQRSETDPTSADASPATFAEPGADGAQSAASAETVETADADDLEAAAEEAVEESGVDAALTQPIPEELPVDSNWDDIFQPSAMPSTGRDIHRDIEDNDGAEQTLNDQLRWQLNLTPMSETDRTIAEAIIDAVNADGMLELTIADLLEGFDPRLDIGADEVEAVLKRIQHFDPTGVAARNLAECLTLQLDALDPSTPARDAATAIVGKHLALLAAKDFAGLQRKTGLSAAELAEAIALIESLHPRPGAALATGPAEYAVPDVVVRRDKSRWLVELNPETTPSLRINAGYAALIRRADNSRQNTWLKDNLQEARWFIKSLKTRHDTLLKVATKIVELQRGFLEQGEEAMKPLVLRDVATAVDLHESTISRITSHKTIQTPRGLFELKYFFSSNVATVDGNAVSSTAIRALIKKLTAEENPRKPLSDNQIAAILAQRSIKVARRTVAKYRESISIPPSSGRKRLR